MSRLRSRFGRSENDRELHGYLGNVQRLLDRALDVCTRVTRNRDPHARLEVHRAQQMQRELKELLSRISALGYLTPSIDQQDPDLTPEDLKVPPARARRESRLAERAQKREELRQLSVRERLLRRRLGWAR